MPAALRRRRRAGGSDVILIYQPAQPRIAGDFFSRSSPATQLNVDGVYQNLGNDIPCDRHYIQGVNTFLMQPQRQNSALWAGDFTNAAWVGTNTGTRNQTAVGILGSLNSATVLADTDAVNAFQVAQGVAIANDAAVHCATFWVRKDTDQSSFPELKLTLSGGTIQQRGVQLNTQTGAAVLETNTGTCTHRVYDAGQFWAVEITVQNNTTGNVTATAVIMPAAGTVLGTFAPTTQGSHAFAHCNIELNSSFGTTPILTTNAVQTRNVDTFHIPMLQAVGGLTVFAEVYELGNSLVTNPRIADVDQGVGERWRIDANVAKYRGIRQNNGGASAVQGLAASIGAFGAQSRLRLVVGGDGSAQMNQSINGAAETGTATSTSIPFQNSMWGQTYVNLASAGGIAAYTALVIAAGQKTLSYMRALIKPQGLAYVGWGDSLIAGAGGTAPLVQVSGSYTPTRGYSNQGVGGETSSQILTRVNADVVHRSNLAVFWMGRNNYTSPVQVKADIAAAIATITSGQFIVLSVLNGEFPGEYLGAAQWITITTLNNDLAALYPNNYIDVRAALVAAYDPTNAQDVIDYGHDIPPSSKRFDNIHPNTAGNKVVADAIRAFTEAKGW